MTLIEWNKIHAQNNNNNNLPTAWGCQSNQPTGRGGISSTSSTLYNPISRGGVGYSGR